MPNRTVGQVKYPGRLTFGADPEFELVVDGKFEPAWPHYGNNGRPVTSGERTRGTVGKIGTDGHAETLELRPDGAPSVDAVIEDIRGLLRIIYRDRGHRLAVGGSYQAIGAHIHFGVGKEGWVPPELVQLMDDFLGRLLVNLSGPARASEFRQLGSRAVRPQPHGFEYRALPAAIFHSPRVAEAVFALAQKLAEEVGQGPITYEVDQNGCATREEYAKRLGSRRTRLLFRFVARYRDVLVRHHKQGKPLVMSSGEWLGGTPAEDEVRMGLVNVSVSGCSRASELAARMEADLTAMDVELPPMLVFGILSRAKKPVYAGRVVVPDDAAEDVSSRYLVGGNMLGIDSREIAKYLDGQDSIVPGMLAAFAAQYRRKKPPVPGKGIS